MKGGVHVVGHNGTHIALLSLSFCFLDLVVQIDEKNCCILDLDLHLVSVILFAPLLHVQQ